MIADQLIPVSIAFAGGLVLGGLYLGLLRASVRCFLSDARALLGIWLTIARMALVGAGLWVSVQFGASVLFGVLIGFTAIRVFATRKMGVQPWI